MEVLLTAMTFIFLLTLSAFAFYAGYAWRDIQKGDDE